MTSAVIFYRLKSQRDFGKTRLVCKLVETAFNRGHKVFVATADEEKSRELDRWLWTYSWSSFIPHAIQSGETEDLDKYPVLIGHSPPVGAQTDVLLTTLDEVPDFAAQFDRIVDPVDAGTSEAQLATRREQQYRDLIGLEPVYHDV